MSRRVPVLEGQLCKRNYTWFRRNGLFFSSFLLLRVLLGFQQLSHRRNSSMLSSRWNLGETTRLWVTKTYRTRRMVVFRFVNPALMMSTAPTAQTIVPRTAVMIEFFRSRSTSSTSSSMRPRRVLVASRRMKIEQGSGTAVRMVGKSPAQRSTGSK